MLTERDKKKVKELYLTERECGHLLIDDSEESARRDMAECLDIALDFDEEEEEWFIPENQIERIEEALSYYYELHA